MATKTFGQSRAASFTYIVEIEGLSVGTFNNVSNIGGIDVNMAEATDSDGQIHEVPMRWKNKRITLSTPVEGTVLTTLYELAKNKTVVSGSIIIRDTTKTVIATHSFQGGRITTSGADGGDRESDGFIMANFELTVDEWLS